MRAIDVAVTRQDLKKHLAGIVMGSPSAMEKLAWLNKRLDQVEEFDAYRVIRGDRGTCRRRSCALMGIPTDVIDELEVELHQSAVPADVTDEQRGWALMAIETRPDQGDQAALATLAAVERLSA